jgi:enoyl-CoA hydratase/carnithine racemase
MTGLATSAEFAALPPTLRAERHGTVAVLKLARPEKRNALDDATVLGIEAFFTAIPDGIGAVVLAGEGQNFSAGLDLAELSALDVVSGVEHSRFWHRVFEKIEFGKVPAVAVLHGAVIGGGLELAAACHVRVAERSAFYALPETSRGIFVGGGGAVRLPPLIGTARIMDMMLTGRALSAEEGRYWLRQRDGACTKDRRQHTVHQLRRDAHPATHRQQRSGHRLCHRGAGCRDRAGR